MPITSENTLVTESFKKMGKTLSRHNKAVRLSRACSDIDVAIRQVEKQIEFEAQHGPVRVIMKNGKRVH